MLHCYAFTCTYSFIRTTNLLCYVPEYWTKGSVHIKWDFWKGSTGLTRSWSSIAWCTCRGRFTIIKIHILHDTVIIRLYQHGTYKITYSSESEEITTGLEDRSEDLLQSVLVLPFYNTTESYTLPYKYIYICISSIDYTWDLRSAVYEQLAPLALFSPRCLFWPCVFWFKAKIRYLLKTQYNKRI